MTPPPDPKSEKKKSRKSTLGARMLDSIYQMTLNFFSITFWEEKAKILSLCMQCSYGRHYTLLRTVNH